VAGPLPINDELAAYAEKVKVELETAGLRVEIDRRTESLNRKVRDAQLAKTPLILTIGAKEKEAGTLSVRTLDGKVRYGIAQPDFLSQALAHVKARRIDFDMFGD